MNGWGVEGFALPDWRAASSAPTVNATHTAAALYQSATIKARGFVNA